MQTTLAHTDGPNAVAGIIYRSAIPGPVGYDEAIAIISALSASLPRAGRVGIHLAVGDRPSARCRGADIKRAALRLARILGRI